MLIPAPFRTRRALMILNVAGVGLALASATCAILTGLFHDPSARFAAATAAPTWVFGTIWAAALRSRKTVGKTTFRWGWAASVPLAILNASVAAWVVFGSEFGASSGLEGLLFGVFAGATMGAIVWVPALVLTLLCFGAPIARAQRLAAKGLAGEERGEWMVGIACVAVAAVGLAVTSTLGHLHGPAPRVAQLLGALGALAGGSATALAFARERRRKRFVAEVEAGRVAGYRVDPSAEGKVLVRVVAQGNGYRVADTEEEVYELDAEGNATRPKRVAEPG